MLHIAKKLATGKKKNCLESVFQQKYIIFIELKKYLLSSMCF